MAQKMLPILQDDSLQHYMKEVWKFPILSAEEELSLAKKYHEEGDLDAARVLVTSHLRLVVKVAAGYKNYGLPVADMIAEGNIGLMKAVQKFDPQKGFRLSTYAMWWIKANITEYILRSWSLVKMGTLNTQKKLFFSLRRIKNKLGITDDSVELSQKQAELISKELDVSSEDIKHFNNRLINRDTSIDSTLCDNNEFSLKDTLVSQSMSPEEALEENQIIELQKQVLSEALAILPQRDQHILVKRQLSDSPETLDKLGQELGISRERVRQIEARAFKKFTEKLKELVQSYGGLDALVS